MFLELPGVTGESSAPGHSGVIALDSVSLSGNGFSVGKPVDSASLPLATAEILGTPYATASILFYSNILSETQPDFSLVYQSVLVSGIATSGAQEHPSESVSFVGAGVAVSHPAPEPAAGEALLSVALLGAAVRTRRADEANPQKG
jgi:type VI protein secretion system component Hcp